MDNGLNDLKRLNFEDFLWGVFIILGILSILGNYYEKEYIKTNDYKYKNYANDVFETTAVVTLLMLEIAGSEILKASLCLHWHD